VQNGLRVIAIGLSAVVSSGCATQVVLGRPDFKSGCFRDSQIRVEEMLRVLDMGEDTGRLHATVEWVRDVDAECEAWRDRPWWRFW